MSNNLKHVLISLFAVFVATALVAANSLADTPKTSTEDNNAQATYPYGMPGGMMGQGYRGYGGMGPGYMHPGGRGMLGYGMGMMQVLNLDKNQRSKIRALMREQRTANCKVMNEIMDVRDQLAAEYDKDQPDAKAIGRLYEKMQGMQRQMIERMVETRNKIRGMMNKEQKENFDNMFHGGMGMMNMMGYGGMGYGGMGYGGMMGPGMMWDSTE